MMDNCFHELACSGGNCEQKLRTNGVTTLPSDLPDFDLYCRVSDPHEGREMARNKEDVDEIEIHDRTVHPGRVVPAIPRHSLSR